MIRIVFVGPTLPVNIAKAELDAVYLPPAAQGDIYRAITRGPAQIGIIDGYFDFVPSVWHKEILYALDQGIEVFGSASTGALRAAELWPFGMRGVGHIFDAFRDGVIEDDDEVALIHAPEELGYLPVSEPMVNIRATLQRAVDEGVLTDGKCARLVGIAKALFYKERTWPAIVAQAKEGGIAAGDQAALCGFLAHGRVDQKRLDAIAMLQVMRNAAPTGGGPAAFHLEETWLSKTARRVSFLPGCSSSTERNLLLDGLRLRGQAWRTLCRRAHTRLALRAYAQQQGAEIDPAEVIAELERIRLRHSLNDIDELGTWLDRNELDAASLMRLARGTLQAKWMPDGWNAAVEAEIVDGLKRSGRFAALRAQDEKSISAAPSPSSSDLLAWYVHTRLDGNPPSDLAAHARSLGFADRDTFMRALRRERARDAAVLP